MARGRGISIGLKLISSSTGLIILLVGMVGYLDYSELKRVYQANASREQERRLVQLRETAVTAGERMAHSVAIALAGNDYAALQDLISAAAKADPQCRYGRIIDRDGMVLADSDPEIQAEILAGRFRKRYTLPKERVTFRIFCLQGGEACTKGALTPEAVMADVHDDLVFEVAVPVMDERQGIHYGHILFGYSLGQLRKDLLAASRDMEARLGASLKRSLAFGALAVFLGVLVAILQGIRMTRPLKNLTRAAARIAKGDFSVRAPVLSRDEIGQLAETFNFMTGRLEHLMEERAREATLKKEMEVARAIQETLIPPRKLVDKGSMRFAGAFFSASICGGDWWSYADLDDREVLVVIGDVTGHGVPSAMITAAAKSSMDTLRHSTPGKLTVTYLLEEMNKTIFAAAQRKFVMTFFASVFDTEKRTLTFSNAGHNFPYLVHPMGEGRPPRIGVLMTRGNRLGDVWDSKFYSRTVTLTPGDVVLWYTDGLVEGTDPKGEPFGDRRLRRALSGLYREEPEAILDGLLARFREHHGDGPLEDDVTLVVAKIY